MVCFTINLTTGRAFVAFGSVRNGVFGMVLGALIVFGGIHAWPYLYYRKAVVDVREQQQVLAPRADDTTYADLTAMLHGLEPWPKSPRFVHTLNADERQAYLARYQTLLATLTTWYRDAGAAQLTADAGDKHARLPVQLSGFTPQDQPLSLSLHTLNRLLLLYAHDAFFAEQPQPALEALDFSLALIHFVMHNPDDQQLMLAVAMLDDTVFFVGELMPPAYLTPALADRFPNRDQLEGSFRKAFWLRAATITRIADDPYSAFKAMNPKFNPLMFRLMGGYHRGATLNMIHQDYTAFAAALDGPWQALRYDQHVLQQPPSQFFSFNPVGRKMMAVGGLLTAQVEPMMINSAVVIARADVVRARAHLAAAGLPLDADNLAAMLHGLNLKDPLTHTAYRFNGQGVVEVLTADDRRWRDVQQSQRVVKGLQARAANWSAQ